MSENIRGITFAEQSVTPADDAIVRRAVLGDGILAGCNISYSGSTLTVAAGYIIACGRAFQITSAQNWAVVDATSGFARLLLTIDLTKTATVDAFSQIDFGIEYAAAENGFVDLVQDDINISGTKYQIVVAMVSLGTGGITGIVSKLENAEGGGAGATLNFDVKAYASEEALLAAVPAENTIGVITTTDISGWAMGDYPDPNWEMSEGFLYINIKASSYGSSDLDFGLLKKGNEICIAPISAKQYVDGAWVDVTCKSYQGGAWADWIPQIYLIKDGVPLYEYKKHHSQTIVTEITGYLELTSTGNLYHGIYFTIDISGRSTLNINGEFTYNTTNISVWYGSTSSPNESNAIATAAVTSNKASLDISSFPEGTYVFGFTYRYNNTEKIANLWLE